RQHNGKKRLLLQMHELRLNQRVQLRRFSMFPAEKENRLLVGSQDFQILVNRGHSFGKREAVLHGGPQGKGLLATRLEIWCDACGRKFTFKNGKMDAKLDSEWYWDPAEIRGLELLCSRVPLN
ncbi:MAG TPA: hypothetical protein VMA09_02540, partial [Candidatus Binataceae bacterium]|nr:hypothetical protein [Candidatus Binataceae bacterium]